MTTDITLVQQLQDAQATIERQRKELSRANELIEYYRQFLPDNPAVSVAAPGFFAHQIGNQNWAAGRLVDGHLEILAQGLDHEEDAVAITWNHYKELTA